MTDMFNSDKVST